MNLVNIFRQVWFSVEACNSISCWNKWFIVDWDSIDCWDRDWSAERCFSLNFNIVSCNQMLIFFRMFIIMQLIFSCFNLWVCSTCRMIQCLLHFKIIFHWSLSSFNILMILFNWSRTHWRSCFLILMFHEIVTFWDLAEALKERRETHLFAMLLSRWVIQSSTDIKLHIMMRDLKIKIDK